MGWLTTGALRINVVVPSVIENPLMLSTLTVRIVPFVNVSGPGFVRINCGVFAVAATISVIPVLAGMFVPVNCCPGMSRPVDTEPKLTVMLKGVLFLTVTVDIERLSEAKQQKRDVLQNEYFYFGEI